MAAGDDELDRRLAAWMQAAQAGDKRAYADLLRACTPLIGRIAARQGLTGASIEDAVQDTLITIHQARHTYDPARPFLPWLRALARHRAIDQQRRRGRTASWEVHAPLAVEAAPEPSAAADATLAAREDAERVRAMVERLPPGQRQAVEHLALGERSLEDTAAATGRTKVALKVNLHRAILSMRARFGGPPDE